jgi:hypothetical protein
MYTSVKILCRKKNRSEEVLNCILANPTTVLSIQYACLVFDIIDSDWSDDLVLKMFSELNMFRDPYNKIDQNRISHIWHMYCDKSIGMLKNYIRTPQFRIQLTDYLPSPLPQTFFDKVNSMVSKEVRDYLSQFLPSDLINIIITLKEITPTNKYKNQNTHLPLSTTLDSE